ncbi:unnamed protein product [Haemonchus placei]|uniref:Uncharacterized protein n=1 Tax=Haemonchus placei TaxID=6290 RepID=A0A0N4W5R8_HAEPC|nr:unnamed protein product [Haemonchus placei]
MIRAGVDPHLLDRIHSIRVVKLSYESIAIDEAPMPRRLWCRMFLESVPLQSEMQRAAAMPSRLGQSDDVVLDLPSLHHQGLPGYTAVDEDEGLNFGDGPEAPPRNFPDKCKLLAELMGRIPSAPTDSPHTQQKVSLIAAANVLLAAAGRGAPESRVDLETAHHLRTLLSSH